jgi:hypothetical protein
MLHDILSGWQAANTAQADITNAGLAKIDEHLTKLNGKVAEHEKIININLPHTINACAQKDTITEIRDNMVSGKAMRKTIITSVTLTGGIFSTLFIIYKVFIEPYLT